MDIEKLKQDANGRWEGIYSSFGIQVPENYKHGPCPVCGGKDRFRLIKDRKESGSWYCSQCDKSSGDGWDLVQRFFGIDFIEACNKVAPIVGTVEFKNPIKTPTGNEKDALNRLWKSSSDLTGSDPVSKYLHSRGINLTPNNVRFCPECYNSEQKTKLPAMVAKIHSSDSRPISIHRTYLANVESRKKIMTGTEELNGSAIRLFSPEDDLFEDGKLGIAEGIESACSAAQRFLIATWSVINTTLMEAWSPPEKYKHIYIFGDNDKSFAGQKSAYILANKLFLEGIKVSVVIPLQGDWNNVLMGEYDNE